MATNYGVATLGVTDVPLKSVSTTDGILIVGQRLARRLTTPRGALSAIGGDADFGWDVRQYINGRLSAETARQAKVEIEKECLKDPEVATALATLVYTFNGPLTISIQITGATGPFALVLPVQNLTAAMVYPQ